MAALSRERVDERAYIAHPIYFYNPLFSRPLPDGLFPGAQNTLERGLSLGYHGYRIGETGMEALREAKKGVTIVLFSGELDKALAAFVIATAAASMGMPVSIFFTFWGLNVLKKKGGLIRGQNWMQRMLNAVNYGHARRLALPKLNMR